MTPCPPLWRARARYIRTRKGRTRSISQSVTTRTRTYHLPTPTIIEAHLREMMSFRCPSRLEQDTTIGNIINTYRHNPFGADQDDEFVDVDLFGDLRPSSLEIFRNHTGPPRAPLPDLPSAARRMSADQRITFDHTDLPSSDQAYGNTGDLLDLDTPRQRHFNGGVLFPDGRVGPISWTHTRRMPTPLPREADADSDWESLGTDMDDTIRRSEESYANTSVVNSQHRLSYPRSQKSAQHRVSAISELDEIPPVPRASRTANFQDDDLHQLPQTDTRTPVLPPWRHVAESGDTQLAEQILRDKMLQDGVFGQMGYHGPRQDIESKKGDMKALEELRKKNPSALRAAVDGVLGRVSNFPSSLNAIFGAHSDQDIARQNLLDNAFLDGMKFSPTLNSFRTSTPDGYMSTPPQSPEG